MATEYKRTYAAWAEVFSIFAKYAPDVWGDVAAHHDEIYAGPDAEEVSEEDRARLEELGWTPNDEGGFHRFT
jgi:hypothetical protein